MSYKKIGWSRCQSKATGSALLKNKKTQILFVKKEAFVCGLKRFFWFAAGIFINAFGVALITKAGLGSPPIAGMTYILSNYFPFTMGQVTFLLNLLFILIQIALLRKKFHPAQFLQIITNILFSTCIDISLWLLKWVEPSSFFVKLGALLVGCLVLAMGIAVEVAPNLIFAPGDGLVRVIAQVSGKPFGTVKLGFDAVVVLCAVILSLLLFHALYGVGLGTVVAALLVGRTVNNINRHVPLVQHIQKL